MCLWDELHKSSIYSLKTCQLCHHVSISVCICVCVHVVVGIFVYLL